MPDQIERAIDLDVPLATVWQALSDPAWLEQWLADEVELALEPGGEARFIVEGRPRTGWVEEVTPPHGGRPARLAFWWQGHDVEPASRVTLELTSLPGGTRLRITETQPLEILDLVGIPMRGAPGTGGATYGPALVAAA